MSKRTKFWIVSFLCIALAGISLGNYYEILRRKAKAKAKAKKSDLREVNILLGYILAKNKSDYFGFAKKFAAPDSFDFSKIKDSWNRISFLYHAPYLMFQYQPNIRSPYLNTNNSGFRGKDDFSYLPSDKPDTKYRYVILLGGSTAFGAYSSSDDKCIAAVLENKLNQEYKDGKRFKVINLSMGFYNSFQELIAFMLYGLKYNPEFVITLDGFNDYAVPLLQHKRVPMATGSYYQTKELVEAANNKALKGKIKNLKSIRSKGEDCWDKESEDYENDVVELYLRNLGLICLVAKENGAKVLLTLQPLKIFPDGKFAWEDKSVENCYKIIQQKIKNFAESRGVQSLNFQNIFKENISFNQYFIGDPVHLNDRGQEIVATYMFSEIKKAIEKGK